EVSNGDVQIIVGDNAFRYHDRQSDVSFGAYTGNALTLTDNADITVGNLHLESTYENGDISIDGQIVANGAWSYVGRYNNQSIVPLESVTVKSNGNITLLDQIIAANKVEVESTNNVYITPMGGQGEFLLDNIRGAEVDIAAVGLVKNAGVIAAEGAYLSANQVVNEGDIEASREIYINGKHSVNNQFGGVLLGENIHLKSERKVTNGSLYPYRLVPKQSAISAYSRNTAPDIKVGGKLAVPPPPSSMEKVDVETLEAYILGQNIKVEANDFINANPYEVTRAGFFMREAQLDANKSGQVIVSAESTLDLRLGYRFWNMSAIAESWTGNTIIHAPVIDNERYYIWADTYSRKACSSIPPGQLARPGHPWYDCYKNNDWRHKQYIRKLSPPAHINTGANLILKADSLNNEHSAVEVRNDVVGNVSNVWMEGLSLREIWFKTTVTHHSRTYCTRRIFRKCFRRKTARWTTSKTELTKNAEIAEFPFVFYVDGHIHQGFGTSRVLMQDITFGPYATSYIPKVTPTKPSKPSKYIPIINSGITFFVPNPNFKE
ncbi:hypothetical protein, partial [Vibrio tubiashii]|uniref:hypothetical protein n=1 Tax=Vibrio tubiashii TaxID=29498 RepID=UPI00349E8B4C